MFGIVIILSEIYIVSPHDQSQNQLFDTLHPEFYMPIKMLGVIYVTRHSCHASPLPFVNGTPVMYLIYHTKSPLQLIVVGSRSRKRSYTF